MTVVQHLVVLHDGSLCVYVIFSYIKHPEGRRVTTEFLQSGRYQVEVMGNRYDAAVYFISPFDPNGKRQLGIYDEQLPVRQ